MSIKMTFPTSIQLPTTAPYVPSISGTIVRKSNAWYKQVIIPELGLYTSVLFPSGQANIISYDDNDVFDNGHYHTEITPQLQSLIDSIAVNRCCYASSCPVVEKNDLPISVIGDNPWVNISYKNMVKKAEALAKKLPSDWDIAVIPGFVYDQIMANGVAEKIRTHYEMYVDSTNWGYYFNNGSNNLLGPTGLYETLGFYDLAGGVWCGTSELYGDAAIACRGGSVHNRGNGRPTACRANSYISTADDYVGFRLVLWKKLH